MTNEEKQKKFCCVCFFFSFLDELMRAIQKDIQNAERLLDSENSRRYLRETFFENLSK